MSLVLVYDFLCQRKVVLASGRVGIVEDYRQTVARALAQFHVSLYDCLEHELLEMAFHLVVYLVGESETAVIHRQQESFYLQFLVQFAFYYLNGVQQFADAFEREVFALHRNQHAVGRHEGVHRGVAQRRGTVDEDEVISPKDGLQSISM